MNSKQLHRVTPIPRDRYIPACAADACEQGRIPCPCPYSCQVPESESPRGLLASPAFCWGGVLSMALWSAAYLILKAVLS